VLLERPAPGVRMRGGRSWAPCPAVCGKGVSGHQCSIRLYV